MNFTFSYRIIFFYVFILSFLFTSCSLLNQAYVPVAYEPMQLSPEKTTRISITHGSSLAKLQIAQAIKPNIGIALNGTIGFGATNTEAIVSYFKVREKNTFEVGIGTGFQENNISYNGMAKYIPENILYSRTYTYYDERVNSSYQTLFLCGAFFLNSPEEGQRIGLCLKTGGAYIYNYNYYFKSYNGDRYIPGGPYDLEQLQFKNGMFFSAEASILYMVRMKRAGFRLQLGYNYCSPAVQHIYYFEQRGSQSNNITSASKNHPTFNKAIFSAGFVFTLNRRKD